MKDKNCILRAKTINTQSHMFQLSVKFEHPMGIITNKIRYLKIVVWIQMEILSVQFNICDEKCKYCEQVKEVVQLNYIKADIDVLRLGAETIFIKGQ